MFLFLPQFRLGPLSNPIKRTFPINHTRTCLRCGMSPGNCRQSAGFCRILSFLLIIIIMQPLPPSTEYTYITLYFRCRVPHPNMVVRWTWETNQIINSSFGRDVNEWIMFRAYDVNKIFFITYWLICWLIGV